MPAAAAGSSDCTPSRPCERATCVFCGPELLLDNWDLATKLLDGRRRPDRAPIVGDDQPRYTDMGVLDGDTAAIPEPVVLHRVDGQALLYVGKVNVLYGDSESGKTWIALAAIAEVLHGGGRAAFVDLDHNGGAEIGGRLLLLGVTAEVIKDQDRFRHCEPGDAAELGWFVTDLANWAPTIAIVDSIGEMLPMLGLSSNSPDDYTIGNRKVLTPLADAKATVVGIDHLPKDPTAREQGQTGTLAKKRAVNGVTLRVSVREQFAPGRGGVAGLTVTKDRPGGLRGQCPPGRNAPAGYFHLTDDDGALSWHITRPWGVDDEGVVLVPVADLVALDELHPPPRTKRDVQERLGWGSDKAQRTLKVWREQRKHDP